MTDARPSAGNSSSPPTSSLPHTISSPLGPAGFEAATTTPHTHLSNQQQQQQQHNCVCLCVIDLFLKKKKNKDAMDWTTYDEYSLLILLLILCKKEGLKTMARYWWLVFCHGFFCFYIHIYCSVVVAIIFLAARGF